MLAYLIRDFVWRNRQMYLFMTPTVGVIWIPITLGAGPPHWGITLALFMAVILGPMSAVSTVGLKEIRILPIEFRDLWTLTWVVSTVVSSALVLATAGVGVMAVWMFDGPVPLGIDGLLLTAVYSFIYTNAVLVLLPALNYVTRQMKAGHIRTALTVVITACMVGSMGLPLLLAPLLPLSLAQLSTGWMTLLALGILGSIGVLAWRPSTGIGTGPVSRALTPATRPRSTPWPLDRLAGPPRILVPHVLHASLLTALAVLCCAWWVWKWGGTDIAWIVDEHVSVMAYMLIGTTSPWMPWMRLLKNLPLSVRSLTVLLLLTPVMSWCAVMLTLMLLDPVFGNVIPVWLTPVVLFWFGGMSAFVNSLAIRNRGAMFWVIGPAAGTGVLVRGLPRDILSPDSLWLVLGATLAFAAAAWINHRTLTRCGSSSRAFRKRVLAPFGISGPSAPQ